MDSMQKHADGNQEDQGPTLLKQPARYCQIGHKPPRQDVRLGNWLDDHDSAVLAIVRAAFPSWVAVKELNLSYDIGGNHITIHIA